MFPGSCPSTRPHSALLHGVALCLAFALVAVMSGPARASCGDWIVGHGLEGSRHAAVAPVLGGAGDRVAVDVASSVPPRSPLPSGPVCSGPACRSVPLPPAQHRDNVGVGISSEHAHAAPVVTLTDPASARCAACPADEVGASLPRVVPTPPPKAFCLCS